MVAGGEFVPNDVQLFFKKLDPSKSDQVLPFEFQA